MHVVIQCAVLYATSLVLWRVLKRVIVKGDLDYVPGPPAESFLKGALSKLFNEDGWAYHRYLWDTYGSVTKVKGVLGENILYIYDPKSIHHVLIKDQTVYQPAESTLLSIKLLFGNGLLATLGGDHKKQRKMLNPVFSINHMREMVPMFYSITHKLERSLINQVTNSAKEIDMVFWMGRTALEIIGQSGFGHSFDDLSEDYDEHCYSTALKQLVPASFPLMFFRTYFLKPAMKLGTPQLRRWLISYLPVPALKKLRDITDVLHQTSLSIYQDKKARLLEGDEKVTEQIGKGKDILSILMKQNMEADEEDKLEEEEIYAQISTFTFAGMDTTSNALSRTLWLLAQHKYVQVKLREEIRQARNKADGDIPYDELVSMPYLDAICRETLRLYAPVSQLIRQPIQDTVLPISNPMTLTNGQKTSELHVPKGTKCVISILGSNRNVEIWGQDAEEWRPERWLAPMDEVADAKIPGIYSHLMTFGAGGRACIGFKFSQLEMKAVLANLISRFDFSPGKDEIAWQMTGVVIPVLANGDKTKPCMPLKVAFAS